MNTITKKITAIILVFALFCSLFVGIDLKSTAKGEEANGENAKIEWQMFLKERNHTNSANPMEIGIFDPVIEWDKSIDVIVLSGTINLKNNAGAELIMESDTIASIDKKGKLVFAHKGYREGDTAEIEEKIRQLLNAK